MREFDAGIATDIEDCVKNYRFCLQLGVKYSE